MTEAEFEDMLQRYLNGTSRPGERELIEQWSNQLGSPENLVLPPAEHEQVRAAMWNQIEYLTQENAAHEHTPRKRWHLATLWHRSTIRWVAAALLAIGVALAVVLPYKHQQAALTATHAPAKHWQQHYNGGKQARLLALADGSRVTLYPGSTLRYKAGMTGLRREVQLRGEAIFQVAKNPKRPFLVYTDQLVTTVLGTSFRVQAYKNRRNEVAVQEGRVSVQLRRGANLRATPVQPAPQGIVLLPNQRVTYSALTPRPLRKQLVKNPAILAPQLFTFDKQPVSKVLQALEKAYGIEIIYDSAKLANCTITITFYQEPLYEKLDLLSKALGASYSTVADARIRFDSEGCTP